MQKIFIIDDSELDLTLTRQLIEHVGIDTKPLDIVGFSSSKEALDMLINIQKDEGVMPSLIIIDLSVNGEEGFGFLSELENVCDVKVVVTANKFDHLEIVDQFDCVVDYIRKPLGLNKVGRIVGLI